MVILTYLMDKIYKDKKPSFRNLIEKFKNHGFYFSEFKLQCEDPCLPVDTEWNYKDIAHVSFFMIMLFVNLLILEIMFITHWTSKK